MGLCSEVVVSAALRNKSLDNVTAIIIGFKPLIKNLMVSRITLSPGPVTKLVY